MVCSCSSLAPAASVLLPLTPLPPARQAPIPASSGTSSPHPCSCNSKRVEVQGGKDTQQGSVPAPASTSTNPGTKTGTRRKWDAPCSELGKFLGSPAARQDKQVWWVAWKRRREGWPSTPCRDKRIPTQHWGNRQPSSPLSPEMSPVTFLSTRAFHDSHGHRSRTRRGRAPSPASSCLGPYFTGEQIPIGRVTAQNQELKAILNELSK